MPDVQIVTRYYPTLDSVLDFSEIPESLNFLAESLEELEEFLNVLFDFVIKDKSKLNLSIPPESKLNHLL